MVYRHNLHILLIILAVLVLTPFAAEAHAYKPMNKVRHATGVKPIQIVKPVEAPFVSATRENPARVTPGSVIWLRLNVGRFEEVFINTNLETYRLPNGLYPKRRDGTITVYGWHTAVRGRDRTKRPVEASTMLALKVPSNSPVDTIHWAEFEADCAGEYAHSELLMQVAGPRPMVKQQPPASQPQATPHPYTPPRSAERDLDLEILALGTCPLGDRTQQFDTSALGAMVTGVVPLNDQFSWTLGLGYDITRSNPATAMIGKHQSLTGLTGLRYRHPKWRSDSYLGASIGWNYPVGTPNPSTQGIQYLVDGRIYLRNLPVHLFATANSFRYYALADISYPLMASLQPTVGIRYIESTTMKNTGAFLGSRGDLSFIGFDNSEYQAGVVLNGTNADILTSLQFRFGGSGATSQSYTSGGSGQPVMREGM